MPIFRVHHTHTHQISAETATLLRGIFGHDLLAALKQMETRMVQRIESLRADFAAFLVAFEAYKASVNDAVAKAVAADDAEEEGVIAALQADIAAATASLPPVPVVEPPVE